MPIFPAATAPFPKSRASYFRSARFNTSPLYYLRAWHRLRCRAFYQQRSNLPFINSGCCRLRNIVAKSRELVLFFATISIHRHVALFTSPRPEVNVFCRKRCNSRVWRDSRLILSNQKSVFRQLATTLNFEYVWQKISFISTIFAIIFLKIFTYSLRNQNLKRFKLHHTHSENTG